MQSELEHIVAAAIRAPSGDNTQPWSFEIDAAIGRIEIHVDPMRDRSPMNANQRMARIACGAAVENMVRAGKRHGLIAELSFVSDGVALQFYRRAMRGDDHGVAERVTNRRLYDARPVSDDDLAALCEATASHDNVSAHWITSRSRVDRLAPIIAASDTLMFGESTMRNAFLANVRFDMPMFDAVEEGLCLGALEVNRAQIAAMKKMSALPDIFFTILGGTIFGAHTKRLIASASGICVISAAGADAAADFRVGRMMQRAWLTMTNRGMAIQPMMSLPVLANALEHAPAETVMRIGASKITSLLDRFTREVPEIGVARAAAILRFGYAAPPTARTGRRPIEAALTANASAEAAHA